jgi:hypothetical protein
MTSDAPLPKSSPRGEGLEVFLSGRCLTLDQVML